MSEIRRVEREIGGRKLSIETGRIARQADGAVVVQYGDTVVLVAAVTAPPRFDDIDFFPLSVEYREKHSAAGKFPGGFIKREGRPSTKETLTARMIDRPIRPLFPEGYVQEVQVFASVMSFDGENDPDILGMIGASAALCISKIPFQGPIGSCRLGRLNGEFIINPTHQQLPDCDLNLLLGGRKEAINMIEVAAKELPENVIADAVAEAHKTVGEICDMISELQAMVAPEKETPLQEFDEDLYAKIKSEYESQLAQLKDISDKKQRNTGVNELYEKVFESYCGDESDTGDESKPDRVMVKRMLHKLEGEVLQKRLLEGKRSDGRGYQDLRNIDCQVGVLPRVHGSALFSRGETQAMVVVTLGTVRDAQIIDGLLEEYTQNFTLHYNFPPFSVGEVRPIRGPGRREIGHGALAERALEQVKPPEDKFAYTIRLVSDITESNGSSSMASVCGGSLALMDAGVPITKPVAGISIGMISDGKGRYELLTDILGEEDHFGLMDFKVAGTTDGITAIQLDIKAEGLAENIMVEALERARVTRLQILDIMSKAIEKPREKLSTYAPKLVSIEIDPQLIGKVIGPGGKMVKSIQEQTGTTVEIEEDGTIYISCVGGENHLVAREMIEALTTPPQVGKIYPQSKVVSVREFGAFVEIVPGVEGLCHISELDSGYVKNVEDVCKAGDVVPVKLLSVDDQGRYKLSRKAALAEMEGKDKKDAEPVEQKK
ncbi:MAG: polyribonucleotide nucleotidyltransferase [Phycisphaerales bacterium]|jgi:polyribonucleotide nucleotidyltransferase